LPNPLHPVKQIVFFLKEKDMNLNDRHKYREEIKTMLGFEIHWACVRLMQCHKIFLKNSEELINYSKNLPIIHYFLMPDIKTRVQKIELDCEAGRLIHNYVASAKTLVDISRRNRDKYINSETQKEYDIITKQFKNNPCTLIIQNLRNFILHVDMPTIANIVNPLNGKSSSLALLPDKLLKWDKWNKIEKKYFENLIQKNEKIIVHEFFSEYTEKADFITNWLLKAITDNNNKELSNLYDLHDKILEGVKADGLETDPLFIHFFSRNEQYDKNYNIIRIF
jgi:hypothetical protein